MHEVKKYAQGAIRYPNDTRCGSVIAPIDYISIPRITGEKKGKKMEEIFSRAVARSRDAIRELDGEK